MKSKRFKLTRLSVVVLIFTLLISAVFNSKPAFAQSESKRKVLENIMENENVKARILWYDLSANLENLNSPEKVKSIVKKTADANINTIVLDVKSSAGFVPYDSEYS